jgi:hypothetical protein
MKDPQKSLQSLPSSAQENPGVGTDQHVTSSSTSRAWHDLDLGQVTELHRASFSSSVK